MEGFAVGELVVEERNRKVTVPVTGGAAVLTAALRALDAAGIDLQDVGLRRPTLNDVFLMLTGHTAEPNGQTSSEESSKVKTKR